MTLSSNPSQAVVTRTRILLAASGALLLGLLWGSPAPAFADSSAEGAGGQELTVTQSEDLDPEGTEVTITGAGYDEGKGIYVAICVDNGEGERPTPCIGGVDMAGDSGSNAWISSNPPSYGKDLVTPFGENGSFEVELTIQGSDEVTDCKDSTVAPNGCVLATYADHTRLDDRSADVLIPLTFGEPGATAPTEEPPSAEPTEEPSESAEPTETPPSNPEVESTSDASEMPVADTTDQAGTPPEFWLYLGLAAVALIGAFAVIA